MSARFPSPYDVAVCALKTVRILTNVPAPNLLYAHESGQSPAEESSLLALVNTISALGLSKGTSESGALFEVSGSKLTSARWVRSAGTLLKPDTSFTPSSLRQKWNDIVDLSRPSYPSGPVDPSDVLAGLPKLGLNKAGQPTSLDSQVVVVTGAGAGSVCPLGQA